MKNSSILEVLDLWLSVNSSFNIKLFASISSDFNILSNLKFSFMTFEWECFISSKS